MKEALQLLESSRGIVEIDSGNMWDWEMDMSSLQDKQAELVRRFQELHHKLYLGTSRDRSSESTDSMRLEAAVDPAPIVLISVSMWRSALVVRTESVTLVPLPQLHEHDAVNHAEMLDNAKGAGGRASGRCPVPHAHRRSISGEETDDRHHPGLRRLNLRSFNPLPRSRTPEAPPDTLSRGTTRHRRAHSGHAHHPGLPGLGPTLRTGKISNRQGLVPLTQPHTLRHSTIFHYAGHGLIEANGGSM
ncbi:hypothetical protein CNMCM7691_002030 [Aspergillus felis]|uniref:CHAT domain-containing protein n=1 Tax=Aspergillus felis TaxID=1287682 RepID=A0A8H6QZI5_9EURO|nr:hypothetical protein CNMCM7691_002030 [Aspergillus felis]